MAVAEDFTIEEKEEQELIFKNKIKWSLFFIIIKLFKYYATIKKRPGKPY